MQNTASQRDVRLTELLLLFLKRTLCTQIALRPTLKLPLIALNRPFGQLANQVDAGFRMFALSPVHTDNDRILVQGTFNMRRKLPIGVQTFEKIRGGDYYYVDKPPFAERLIEEGSYYFLSRPRRFGKSLFLDTLKELYEGNEALFKGLYIHDKWGWQRRHPVVRISFGGGVMASREQLDQRINEILSEQAHALGVKLEHQSIAGKFDELLNKAAQQYGARTVLLIDE